MPVIGNLKKLKILSFCGSDIEMLPEELRHLTKLRWKPWDWGSRSKTSRVLKISHNTNEDENILQYLKGIEELELGEVPGATNLFDALDRNGSFPTLKHLVVDLILVVHVLLNLVMPCPYWSPWMLGS
ncbi:hypothetical protein Ddye_028201 [Dipteronia dyeriana]|uniref:Uncharacterized protein n=1 Tax=Dipteronia dyeriana TaxID=168575 RepID=A0AAD9TQR6_9ROSI|nr:hypothetical protein Ddye_028201 [Dipteronia dyeriana]